MNFRISRHSGFAAPVDALDLLWQRLGGDRDGIRFVQVGSEIRATWREPASAPREREVRAEIGRLAVLHVVFDVCERSPELKSDWYAVSPLR